MAARLKKILKSKPLLAKSIIVEANTSINPSGPASIRSPDQAEHGSVTGGKSEEIQVGTPTHPRHQGTHPRHQGTHPRHQGMEKLPYDRKNQEKERTQSAQKVVSPALRDRYWRTWCAREDSSEESLEEAEVKREGIPKPSLTKRLQREHDTGIPDSPRTRALFSRAQARIDREKSGVRETVQRLSDSIRRLSHVKDVERMKLEFRIKEVREEFQSRITRLQNEFSRKAEETASQLKASIRRTKLSCEARIQREVEHLLQHIDICGGTESRGTGTKGTLEQPGFGIENLPSSTSASGTSDRGGQNASHRESGPLSPLTRERSNTQSSLDRYKRNHDEFAISHSPQTRNLDEVFSPSNPFIGRRPAKPSSPPFTPPPPPPQNQGSLYPLTPDAPPIAGERPENQGRENQEKKAYESLRLSQLMTPTPDKDKSMRNRMKYRCQGDRTRKTIDKERVKRFQQNDEERNLVVGESDNDYERTQEKLSRGQGKVEKIWEHETALIQMKQSIDVVPVNMKAKSARARLIRHLPKLFSSSSSSDEDVPAENRNQYSRYQPRFLQETNMQDDIETTMSIRAEWKRSPAARKQASMEKSANLRQRAINSTALSKHSGQPKELGTEGKDPYNWQRASRILSYDSRGSPKESIRPKEKIPMMDPEENRRRDLTRTGSRKADEATSGLEDTGLSTAFRQRVLKLHMTWEENNES